MQNSQFEKIRENIISSISSLQDHMLQKTEQLAAINSGSFNIEGLDRTASALIKLLSPSFDNCETIALAPLEQVNDDGSVTTLATTQMLKFSRNSDAPLQLLMTGHYDTVFPVDSHFQTIWTEGNHLRGPGVADMKGGIVVAQTAIDAIAQSELSDYVGITLLLSPEEEIGSPSSGDVLMQHAKNAHYGLTYEPALADGTLAGQRKGSGNFNMIFSGKSTHAGREFFAGHNAIVAAADTAVKISALSNKDSGITVNIGKISGGGPVNVVPDNAVLRFNIRVGTTEQMAILQEIEEIAAQCASQHQVKFQLKGKFNRPPKEMTPELNELFELLRIAGKNLGLSIRWQPTGGCCEGNNLAAAGLANIDTLGVRGGAIHSDQEFACIDSFVERAQLSALLICELIRKTQFDDVILNHE